jgi:hypothetical protein
MWSRLRLCANSVSTFITIIHSIPRTISYHLFVPLRQIACPNLRANRPIALWLMPRERIYPHWQTSAHPVHPQPPIWHVMWHKRWSNDHIKWRHGVHAAQVLWRAPRLLRLQGVAMALTALSLSLWMHSHSLDQGQTLACRVSERKERIAPELWIERVTNAWKRKSLMAVYAPQLTYRRFKRGGRVQNILALSLAGINYAFGRTAHREGSLKVHFVAGHTLKNWVWESDAHVQICAVKFSKFDRIFLTKCASLIIF